MPRLLVIDNYDSFTFNLAQGLAIVGAAVEVVRNDGLSVAELVARRGDFDGVVLSPGPGRPEESGICAALLDALRHRSGGPDWPLLGVCLGHQLIGQRFGGRVVRAATPIHGKVWPICATAHAAADPLWDGLPQRLAMTRYHSLVVSGAGLPDCLLPTARTEETGEGQGEGVIMALRHTSLPVWGLQFHPESIGSPHGPTLLRNFVRLCGDVATSDAPSTSRRLRRR
jgi:anthranilate synthase component 2